MTVIIAPNPVDEALVTALAADTDPDEGFVALVPGGAWHLVAPEGTANPWCTFGILGPSEDTYTMGGWAFSRMLYGFDVVQEGGSAERAQTAARRLDFLLTNKESALNPVLAAATPPLVCMAVRRTGYTERLERTEGGVLFQHVQSIIAVQVRPQ